MPGVVSSQAVLDKLSCPICLELLDDAVTLTVSCATAWNSGEVLECFASMLCRRHALTEDMQSSSVNAYVPRLNDGWSLFAS